MAELQDTLPPGWECKLDTITGKHYYVNHYTKTTTWDDPRLRHRPFHGTPKHLSNVEHIPLQHGSPDLRRNYVYPSQTSPIPAFQMPSHQSPKYNPLQELRNSSRMSPLTVRGAKVQDSSLTIHSESDDAVAKISAMFPTVSESHIRLLMKNCRYMKSIFPQAEETIILDVLYNNDSSIQKTSEILKNMGFQKKEPVKVAQQMVKTKTEVELAEEVKGKEQQPGPSPKMKTTEEKAALKEKLKEKYKDVAEHLITIALESVDYNENRASQILEIMVQEDTEKEAEKNAIVAEANRQESTEEVEASTSAIPVSQSRQSIKSLLRSEKIDKEKSTFNRVIEQDGAEFKSPNLANTQGPNPSLIKGPNDKNLLVDYVDWEGPNLNFKKGPQGLAKGPNPSFLNSRAYQPRGPNIELRKGPKFGLAKGSIFSKLKNGMGESRGK